jgi:hypothetical protein
MWNVDHDSVARVPEQVRIEQRVLDNKHFRLQLPGHGHGRDNDVYDGDHVHVHQP